VHQATEAVSLSGAEALWQAIEDAGARHHRPIGDRWGNRGLFTAAGGTVDHKLVELATNMHDALVFAAVAADAGMAKADLSKKEIITIIYGKDVNEKELEEIKTFIGENYSDLEIDAIDGKQDVYSYILSIE
jgi:hypothetical protein